MPKRLSIYNATTLRYGATNFITNMAPLMQNTFIAFFLTTVVMIDNASLTGVLTLTRSIDLILLPLIGIVIQSSNPRMGRIRFWLLIAGAASIPFFTLQFTALGWNGADPVTFVFYCVMYLGALILVNVGQTAYSAAINLVAHTPQERINCSAVRSQCNTLGKIIFGATSVLVIGGIGGWLGSAGLGYTALALMIAVLTAVFYGNIMSMIKGREPYVPRRTQAKAEKVHLLDMLRYIFTRPLLTLVGAGALIRVATYLVSGLAAYYYSYVAGSMEMLAVYLTLTNSLVFVGAFIGPFIKDGFKLGGKWTYVVGLALYSVCSLLTYVFGASPLMFTILLSLCSVGFGMCMSLEIGLFGHCAQWTVATKKKDVTAFLFSLTAMPAKIGTTLAGLILGLGLMAIGFDAQASETANSVVDGLRTLMALLPAGAAALGIVSMVFFPLTDSRMEEIQAAMNDE
ncbi:MAG: MFS transporter [Gracilibacteraceae bacterium]|jgi:GPH family glycoside/pentoside/hexuronide:cation symporter|nr:MFS transporter [Gracilibacteraceae bacterium]